MVNVQNLIRVGVAAAVGYLVALLAKQGFHLSAATTGVIVTLITGVVAGFYHTLVTALEKHWPWLSVLLGSKPAKPATGTNKARI